MLAGIEAARVDAKVSAKVDASEGDASRTLLVDLPFLAETISSTAAGRRVRLAALVKMTKALALVASTGDSLASSRFDESIVSRVVAFCREDASLHDLDIIGHACSLLSNLCVVRSRRT